MPTWLCRSSLFMPPHGALCIMKPVSLHDRGGRRRASTLVLPKVAVSLPQLGVRERVACHKPAAAKKISEFGNGLTGVLELICALRAISSSLRPKSSCVRCERGLCTIVSANSVHLPRRGRSKRTREHSTRAGQLCPGLGCREPMQHAQDDFKPRALIIPPHRPRHRPAGAAGRRAAGRPGRSTRTRICEREQRPVKRGNEVLY